MKLSEMRQILTAEDIHLTKSLGQNFLHDTHQLDRIVRAAELSGEDKVVEIGPGLGPLTQRLLGEASQVLAIEKDRRLVQVLQRRYAQETKLSLVHADALDSLRREPPDWSGWKLVSNLPYSVASPILVELAKASRSPERLVVTLQLEVAHRLMASPDSRDYGVLTLLVQLAYEPRGWFKIPASCFFPEPEVDSACVTLIHRSNPLLPHHQFGAFEKIVKRGFSQRRKMMSKLLKTDWPAAIIEQAFSKLGLSPKLRAEKVTLDQFAQLTQILFAGTETELPRS